MHDDVVIALDNQACTLLIQTCQDVEDDIYRHFIHLGIDTRSQDSTQHRTQFSR